MLADASLPVATATYTLLLGVKDCMPVLADVALVWLLKLRVELDCEVRPANARRLDREVLVDLDSAKLDRDEDRDNTRPRLEVERAKPRPAPAPALPRLAVTMGTPVAASRRRR